MNVIPIQSSEQSANSRPQFLPGLVTLRAFAALGVVALHSGVPYLRHPMPGLVWPVWDSSSRVVDAIFWSIEVMIMPLFLMIAGFLLYQSSQRQTPSELVRSRAKRLLMPLFFGVVAVLPIAMYIWTMGLVSQDVVSAIKLKSLKFDPPISDQIWGLSHLWFLLYLFLYVALAATIIRLSPHQPVRRVIGFFSQTGVLIASICGIAVTTLIVSPEVVWGFQHAFLPVPSKWIYCGVFVVAGFALAHHDGQLNRLKNLAPQLIVLSAVLLASSVIIGTWSLEQLEAAQKPSHAASTLLAVLTVSAAASAALASIATAARFVKTVPKSIRYVASASFWVYLIHQPLLGLIHIDLMLLWPDGAPVVKLCVSFIVSTSVSLLTFESLVRRTRFGHWLGLSHRVKEPVEPGDESSGSILVFPDKQSPHRRAA